MHRCLARAETLSLTKTRHSIVLHGGVKRPHPTIHTFHSRHVYKTRVTSTNQPSRLQFTTCFVDVTAVNCRVWPFHATVFFSRFVLSLTVLSHISILDPPQRWPRSRPRTNGGGGLPQPGANQRVVLTAGAGVNSEPLRRIS